MSDFIKDSTGKNLATKPNRIAINILEPGPAIETLRSPYFLSLIKLGLYGTGLAQANIKLDPVKTKNNGSSIDPKGSMWGIGLSVNLPKFLAVGSPNLFAIQACPYSWTIIEKTSMAIDITMTINISIKKINYLL